MKPKIAIPLGVAGILAAIGTAIANANGLLSGHPFLAYWLYGASLLLIVISVGGAVADWLRSRTNSPVSPSSVATPASPVNISISDVGEHRATVSSCTPDFRDSLRPHA